MAKVMIWKSGKILIDPQEKEKEVHHIVVSRATKHTRKPKK
jgi:hypothetical protein